MKILMLTPYVPFPPSSGGQIRTYNLLKHLSKKNEITLVCLYKNLQEKKYLTKLKHFCKEIYFCHRSKKPWTIKNILKAIFSFYPFLIVRNYSLEAEDLLKRILKENDFDIIHAETFSIMPHLPKTKIPIFLIEQTIEYKVYQHFVEGLPFFLKPLLNLDILKLKRWERFYWKKANLVGTVSDEDRKEIQKLEPKIIKPVVIPNGAGEDLFVSKISEKKKKNKIRLLFQGNFFWLQNTEAVNYLIKEIYPLSKNIKSKFEIVVAGQNAKKKILSPNKKIIKIINVGPDEFSKVKKIYQDSDIFIAPVFGPGGTRLKILAAMASGVPIISTTIGVQGLSTIKDKDVLIANHPKEFIEKINLILSDKSLYERIRVNAYKLVKEKYSWENISSKLEKVYQDILVKNINP